MTLLSTHLTSVSHLMQFLCHSLHKHTTVDDNCIIEKDNYQEMVPIHMMMCDPGRTEFRIWSQKNRVTSLVRLSPIVLSYIIALEKWINHIPNCTGSQLIFSLPGNKMLLILVNQSNHKPTSKSNISKKCHFWVDFSIHQTCVRTHPTIFLRMFIKKILGVKSDALSSEGIRYSFDEYRLTYI